MEAETDRGARTAVSTAAGRATPRRLQTGPKLIAGARESAVESAGRTTEALGGLVEGKALEATKHHRPAEDPWQTIDLVVDRLGQLAIDHWLVSRRCRWLSRGARARKRFRPETVHHVPQQPAPAGDLCPRGPGSSRRDPVKPVTQQIGVADRSSLAGQNEENGLQRVFGMLHVAQELATDTQHHRTVPAHERCEGSLTDWVVPAGGVPVQKLTIGESGDRARLEERLKLPGHGTGCLVRHS